MFRAVVAALELSPKLVVLSLAVLVMASISIRRHLLRRQYARYHGCQPISKSLNNDPFLGLDTLPGTICAIRQHKVLERGRGLFRVYGNTFTVKEIQRNAIVTTEPENIKTVLSLKFKDYSLSHRLEAFKPLLGEGIFNTDGEHWASSRALIRPSFAREQLADLRLLEELIQDLFGLLPRDGTTVDLQELFFRYTIDSATGFLFGQSVRTLRIGEPEFGFAEAFHYAQNAILARATLGPVLNSVYRDQKANECNYFCRTFVQRFVKGAVHAAEVRKQDTREGDKTKRKRIVFSHELASRTSDEERILDELMNVLLAGRDTTASLLGNLFFMLAKKPAIWKKLRSEVDILGNRPPTYEELQRLKYVQYCVNESLRLHPVVPRNGRKAIRDTVLPLGGGKDGLSPVFVPKGTLVNYNIYAMHRRQDLYGPDAEEFLPERWEDGRLRPGWGYLPFNGGPRICIGQRYALTEVSYVLVRMVQEFRRLESRDPGPWEEKLAMTLCSRNGAKVALIP